MNSFKNMMSRIDSVIAEQDKTAPVSVSGLLGRTKTPSKQIKMDTPEAQIAKYVAMIRKQREALKK